MSVPDDETGLDIIGYLLVAIGAIGIVWAFQNAGSFDQFLEAVRAFQPIILGGIAAIVGGGAVIAFFKNR